MSVHNVKKQNGSNSDESESENRFCQSLARSPYLNIDIILSFIEKNHLLCRCSVWITMLCFIHVRFIVMITSTVLYILLRQLFNKNSLSTQWFHGYHILGTCQWQLNNFQQSLTHTLQGFYTCTEGDQEDVEPCHQKSDWPTNEPQNEEPNDAPNQPRAQSTTSTAVSLPLSLTFSQTHLRSNTCTWKPVNRNKIH